MTMTNCSSTHLQASAVAALVVLLFCSTVNAFSSPLKMSASDGTSTTVKPFALNVRFSVKPERRDEFLSVIRTDRTQTTETEPLALQFVVGEDTDTPNTFYLHEQYLGEEGFQAHQATPHFAAWNHFVASSPFTEEPVVDIYVGTHAPTKRTSPPAFCLNVELCIKPEVRGEFLEVIRGNARGSNNDEPLCLQYDYGESTDAPNTFYFHEQYEGADAGKEGFDAHAASPHFAAWETFADTGPFTKPPVVSFYRTLP